MMKYSIALLSFLCVACGGGGSQENSEEASESSSSISNSTSCLADMVETPDQLLPASEAAGIIGVPQSELEQKGRTGIRPSTQITWPSERTKKIGTVEAPVENLVAVSIKLLDKEMRNEKTYAEYFEKYHGGIAEEDKKQISEGIEDSDESDTVKNVGKSLVGVMDFENFQEIDDIGDMANSQVNASGVKYGAPRQTELTVLHGNVIFIVAVDVSDDDDKDFELARKVAEAVVANCD